MSRRRAGRLSDEQTLRAWEKGISAQRLAHAENCTGGAILARVSRARQARDQRRSEKLSAVHEASGMQAPDPYGFDALRAAVDRLAMQEAGHA